MIFWKRHLTCAALPKLSSNPGTLQFEMCLVDSLAQANALTTDMVHLCVALRMDDIRFDYRNVRHILSQPKSRLVQPHIPGGPSFSFRFYDNRSPSVPSKQRSLIPFFTVLKRFRSRLLYLMLLNPLSRSPPSSVCIRHRQSSPCKRIKLRNWETSSDLKQPHEQPGGCA